MAPDLLAGASTVTRRWEFRSPTLRPSPEAREERARALLGALRTGAGIGVRFDLIWESGRDGRVALEVADRISGRWVERNLFAAFEPHQWLPRAAPASVADTGDRVFLRAARGIDIPFSEAGDGPWADAVLSGLRQVPFGVGIRWRARSLGAPRGTLAPVPDLEGRRQPVGYRLRPLTALERDVRDRHSTRVTAPWWEIRAAVFGPSSRSGEAAVLRLTNLVEVASARDGGNRFRAATPIRVLRTRPPPVFLGEAELAGLLPAVTSPWPGAVPEGAPAAWGLTLGRDEEGEDVRLEVPRGEGRHLAILGETGMGKSSTLLRLAAQAADAAALILLDPIGDTGRAFLAGLSSAQRMRVLWISPTDSPVGIDVVATLRSPTPDPAATDRAVRDLVDALRRVRAGRYADTPFWGPRIEETVVAALRAAAAFPEGTLDDAERLLSGTGRRPVGVPAEAESAVDELWARARDRPEEVEGSRRLLAELTGRPILRRLLAARRPEITLQNILSPGRLVVVTGDAAALGESTARYLLSVYLALLWSERLRRTTTTKTFLVLDELQWYAHESIGEMLRLGRRLDLHVILATQSLRALPESTAEAIRTNCADFLLFRGAPDEAREFARWSPGISMERLLAQPRGEATALLGKGSRVVRVTVRPPPAITPAAITRSLEEARSQSAPHWIPVDRPSDPIAPLCAPAGAGLRGIELNRRALLTVWAALLDATGAPSLRISLDRLRGAADPGGEQVRELGRRLREAGLLTRSDRDEGGSFWEVRRRGFEALLGPGVDPDELAEATAAWRASGVAPARSGPTQSIRDGGP